MDKNDAKFLLARLLAEQKVGVLCTAVDGQPYGSPMAFIAATNQQWLAFPTVRGTRKRENLSRNPRVAFVVDNRDQGEIDAATIRAAVAIGAACEVSDIKDLRGLRVSLARRHPGLEVFFNATTTAVFKLTVEKYVCVSGLEESIDIEIES
jgi:hypothetical protein